MNLLHLSTHDIKGGAAQATYRIHALLSEAGHRSVMAVRRKTSTDPNVISVGIRSLRKCSWPERIERVRSRLAGGYRVESRPMFTFNRNLAPVPDWESVLKVLPRPDVVVLHWITGLMTVADIRRLAELVRCPIIWLLMDMEPITGGCHYAGVCERFQRECADCPQLRNGRRGDWARRTWHEKRRQLAGLPITFVAPTKWLADRLTRSGLFRGHPVVHIPLPLNPRMQPLEKPIARKILGLSTDKKIVMVGSHNLKSPRKGMDCLLAAARLLAMSGDARNIEFLIVGSNGSELSRKLPFPSQTMGYVHDDIVLSLAYQSADVFACPSLEDAGPMMVSQAMRCGTPVVAFDTGIVPELLASGDGGRMAQRGDVEGFARGLKEMLADDGRAGQRAEEIAVRHHDPKRIAREYRDLFEKLVQTPQESFAL